jgi:hypothetical protein
MDEEKFVDVFCRLPLLRYFSSIDLNNSSFNHEKYHKEPFFPKFYLTVITP